MAVSAPDNAPAYALSTSVLAADLASAIMLFAVSAKLLRCAEADANYLVTNELSDAVSALFSLSRRATSDFAVVNADDKASSTALT